MARQGAILGQLQGTFDTLGSQAPHRHRRVTDRAMRIVGLAGKDTFPKYCMGASEDGLISLRGEVPV